MGQQGTIRGRALLSVEWSRLQALRGWPRRDRVSTKCGLLLPGMATLLTVFAIGAVIRRLRTKWRLSHTKPTSGRVTHSNTPCRTL
jgi:hypothetical protein